MTGPKTSVAPTNRTAPRGEGLDKINPQPPVTGSLTSASHGLEVGPCHPEGVNESARVAYRLLALAIVLEVAGTLSLRLSDGFTHPGWTIVAISGYATSIVVFGQALVRGMNLGVGYGTLTGVGLSAAALASAVVFSEGLTVLQAAALITLLFGVLLLQPRGQ